MKRLISSILALVLILVSIPAFASPQDAEDVENADGWYPSSDGMIEIKFISLEEANYPNYKVTLQYRLDGKQESELQTYDYNLTSVINQYISKNATNKNRKVKVTSDGLFTKFDYNLGTIYSAKLPVAIGGSLACNLLVDVDLSIIFPDDFVNYDALNIVSCINAHRNVLLNPSSFSFRDTRVVASKKYDNIVYYTYHMTAENKMGGNSTNEMVAIFDTSTGKFTLFVYDLDNLFDPDIITYDVTMPAYSDALVEYLEISNEAVGIQAYAIGKYLR